MLFQIERAHSMSNSVNENGISLESSWILGVEKILQTSRKKKTAEI